MKMAYNDSRKKDRIKEAETTTAKIMTTLLMEEMEYLRLHKPADYLFYLSGNMDSMPIMTNRGQLRSMMDDAYSLRTYSNFIRRLTKCDFILRKQNTSRQRTKVTDENGTVSYKHTITKNGRGDFILFINKAALTFKYSFVQNTQKELSSPKFKIIENQSVSLPKTQKLQQPLNVLKETLKIDNNNSLASVENGVAAPQNKQVSCKQERMLNRRDEEGSIPKKSAAGMSPRGKKYVEKLKKDQQIRKNLPEEEQNYYATLLFIQMIKLLYAHFTDNYIEVLAAPAKNLLRLHLQRLNLPMELAFQTISRAIEMTHKHLEKHKDAYIYAPLTWLRIDDEFKSGTLKTVVDKWIPDERKRLQVVHHAHRKFVNWQYAHQASDKLFLEVVKGMKKGFSTGAATYNAAFKKLDVYFEKYELPKQIQDKMRQQFADRTYTILKEAETLSEENKRDKTWSAFLLFRKMQKYQTRNLNQ